MHQLQLMQCFNWGCQVMSTCLMFFEILCALAFMWRQGHHHCLVAFLVGLRFNSTNFVGEESALSSTSLLSSFHLSVYVLTERLQSLHGCHLVRKMLSLHLSSLPRRVNQVWMFAEDHADKVPCCSQTVQCPKTKMLLELSWFPGHGSCWLQLLSRLGHELHPKWLSNFRRCHPVKQPTSWALSWQQASRSEAIICKKDLQLYYLQCDQIECTLVLSCRFFHLTHCLFDNNAGYVYPLYQRLTGMPVD